MASSYESKNTWTNWRKANFRFFEERLKDLNKDLILFDLGAGPEQFRDITWRFKCVSVDFKQFGTTKVIADLNSPPFPIEEESADIVFISNVLEHIPWPMDFLTECRRILKKGGVIIGTVPFIGAVHQAPYDYNRYTHYMLRILLEKSGFEIKEIIPIGEPVRVLVNMIDQFFSFLKREMKITARLLRYLNYAFLFLFFPILKKAKLNNEFTQGYGFVGFRK